MTADPNVGLTRAVRQHRRTLSQRVARLLNSVSEKENEGEVQSAIRELDYAYKRSARAEAERAFEELAAQGRLRSVVFPHRELGISFVLARFELHDDSVARDKVSDTALSRRLVVVEKTFSHRGGGVGHELLCPTDELLGIREGVGGDRLRAGDYDLVVDPSVEDFAKLLHRLRDAARPLTLCFALGPHRDAARESMLEAEERAAAKKADAKRRAERAWRSERARRSEQEKAQDEDAPRAEETVLVAQAALYKRQEEERLDSEAEATTRRAEAAAVAELRRAEETRREAQAMRDNARRQADELRTREAVLEDERDQELAALREKERDLARREPSLESDDRPRNARRDEALKLRLLDEERAAQVRLDEAKVRREHVAAQLRDQEAARRVAVEAKRHLADVEEVDKREELDPFALNASSPEHNQEDDEYSSRLPSRSTPRTVLEEEASPPLYFSDDPARQNSIQSLERALDHLRVRVDHLENRSVYDSPRGSLRDALRQLSDRLDSRRLVDDKSRLLVLEHEIRGLLEDAQRRVEDLERRRAELPASCVDDGSFFFGDNDVLRAKAAPDVGQSILRPSAMPVDHIEKNGAVRGLNLSSPAPSVAPNLSQIEVCDQGEVIPPNDDLYSIPSRAGSFVNAARQGGHDAAVQTDPDVAVSRFEDTQRAIAPTYEAPHAERLGTHAAAQTTGDEIASRPPPRLGGGLLRDDDYALSVRTASDGDTAPTPTFHPQFIEDEENNNALDTAQTRLRCPRVWQDSEDYHPVVGCMSTPIQYPCDNPALSRSHSTVLLKKCHPRVATAFDTPVLRNRQRVTPETPFSAVPSISGRPKCDASVMADLGGVRYVESNRPCVGPGDAQTQERKTTDPTNVYSSGIERESASLCASGRQSDVPFVERTLGSSRLNVAPQELEAVHDATAGYDRAEQPLSVPSTRNYHGTLPYASMPGMRQGCSARDAGVHVVPPLETLSKGQDLEAAAMPQFSALPSDRGARVVGPETRSYEPNASSNAWRNGESQLESTNKEGVPFYKNHGPWRQRDGDTAGDARRCLSLHGAREIDSPCATSAEDPRHGNPGEMSQAFSEDANDQGRVGCTSPLTRNSCAPLLTVGPVEGRRKLGSQALEPTVSHDSSEQQTMRSVHPQVRTAFDNPVSASWDAGLATQRSHSSSSSYPTMSTSVMTPRKQEAMPSSWDSSSVRHREENHINSREFFKAAPLDDINNDDGDGLLSWQQTVSVSSTYSPSASSRRLANADGEARIVELPEVEPLSLPSREQSWSSSLKGNSSATPLAGALQDYDAPLDRPADWREHDELRKEIELEDDLDAREISRTYEERVDYLERMQRLRRDRLAAAEAAASAREALDAEAELRALEREAEDRARLRRERAAGEAEMRQREQLARERMLLESDKRAAQRAVADAMAEIERRQRIKEQSEALERALAEQRAARAEATRKATQATEAEQARQINERSTAMDAAAAESRKLRAASAAFAKAVLDAEQEEAIKAHYEGLTRDRQAEVTQRAHDVKLVEALAEEERDRRTNEAVMAMAAAQLERDAIRRWVDQVVEAERAEQTARAARLEEAADAERRKNCGIAIELAEAERTRRVHLLLTAPYMRPWPRTGICLVEDATSREAARDGLAQSHSLVLAARSERDAALAEARKLELSRNEAVTAADAAAQQVAHWENRANNGERLCAELEATRDELDRTRRASVEESDRLRAELLAAHAAAIPAQPPLLGKALPAHTRERQDSLVRTRVLDKEMVDSLRAELDDARYALAMHQKKSATEAAEVRAELRRVHQEKADVERREAARTVEEEGTAELRVELERARESLRVANERMAVASARVEHEGELERMLAEVRAMADAELEGKRAMLQLEREGRVKDAARHHSELEAVRVESRFAGEVDSSTRSIETDKVEVQRLESDLETARLELARVQLEATDRLNAQQAESDRVIAIEQRQSSDAHSQIAALQSQLEAQRADSDRMIADEQHQSTEARNEIATLRCQLEAQRADSDGAIAEEQRRLTEAQSEIAALCSQLEVQRTDSDRAIANEQRRLSDAHNEIDALQHEITTLRLREDDNDEQRLSTEAQDELSALRSELAMLRSRQSDDNDVERGDLQAARSCLDVEGDGATDLEAAQGSVEREPEGIRSRLEVACAEAVRQPSDEATQSDTQLVLELKTAKELLVSAQRQAANDIATLEMEVERQKKQIVDLESIEAMRAESSSSATGGADYEAVRRDLEAARTSLEVEQKRASDFQAGRTSAELEAEALRSQLAGAARQPPKEPTPRETQLALELENARETFAAAQRKAADDISALETEVERQKSRVTDLENINASHAVSSHSTTLDTENDAIRRDLETARTLLDAERERATELEAARVSAERDVEGLQSQLDSVRAEVVRQPSNEATPRETQLALELENAKETIAAAEREAASDISALEIEVEKHKNRIAELENIEATSGVVLNGVSSSSARRTADNETAAREITGLKAELEDAQDIIGQQKALRKEESDRDKRAIDDLRAELVDLRTKLADAQTPVKKNDASNPFIDEKSVTATVNSAARAVGDAERRASVAERDAQRCKDELDAALVAHDAAVRAIQTHTQQRERDNKAVARNKLDDSRLDQVRDDAVTEELIKTKLELATARMEIDTLRMAAAQQNRQGAATPNASSSAGKAASSHSIER